MFLEKSLYDFFTAIISMEGSTRQWLKAWIWSQETDVGSASFTWLIDPCNIVLNRRAKSTQWLEFSHSLPPCLPALRGLHEESESAKDLVSLLSSHPSSSLPLNYEILSTPPHIHPTHDITFFYYLSF